MAITKMSNSGIKTGVLKYDSMLAGNTAYQPSGYFSIATVTATTGTTTLTFSSIPATYKALQIRGIARDNGASINQRNQIMRFNGDSGTNYSRHGAGFGAGSIYRLNNTTQNRIEFGYYGGSDNSLAFRAFLIEIPDYANTNKFKTVIASDGWIGPSGGPGNPSIEMLSGSWQSTSAINQITIQQDTGQAFEPGSTFALYGVM